MTQKQKVLAWLQNQPSVCIADLPLELGYCARNRIGDLRRDGYDIRGERCTRHSHAGPVFRYRLLGQRTMAL